MDKRNVLSGQITVFASLVLMFVLTLIITCIRSAYLSADILDINMAANLSVESLFAGYSNKLLSEFDIFGLSREQASDDKLSYYAKNNIEKIGNSNRVSYLSSEIAEKIYMTENAGDGVRQQIVEYMKLGTGTEALADILDIKKENEKSEKIKEITEDIVSFEEKYLQLDKLTLKLISDIEGLKTSENGIETKKGIPVLSGDYFAKSLYRNGFSMKKIEIDNITVYRAVTGIDNNYYDFEEALDEITDTVDLLKLIGEDKSNENGNTSCNEIYKRMYEEVKGVVERVYDKTVSSVSYIDSYAKSKESCKNILGQIKKKVESNSEIIGEEATKTFMADLKDMEGDNTLSMDKMCDCVEMRKTLESNKDILIDAKKTLESFPGELTEDNMETVLQGVNTLREALKKLSNNKLGFNYLGIDFKKSGEGTGAIEKLQKQMKKGVAGIVLSDLDVSDNSYDYLDLASMIYAEGEIGESEIKNSSITQQVTDAILVDRYILNRFECYTDTTDSLDKNESKGTDNKQDYCELKYVLEYIIFGNESDDENINSMITSLMAVREGVNFIYLLTDKEKKNQAFTLASSLVGYTGNAVVVKVAEYLILSVWALGESLYEIRELFKGYSVPLIKKSEDWKLSLDGLLKLKFDDGKLPLNEYGEEDKDKSNDKNGEKRIGDFNYKDYCASFLLLENMDRKIYNLMSVMELRMITLGDKDFRMSKYIYRIDTNLDVKHKYMDRIHSIYVSYGYV